MKEFAHLRGWVAFFCCLTIAVPRPALAALAGATPSTDAPDNGHWHAPVVADVALRSGGVLVGQVLSTEGHPLADMPVAVLWQAREIATTAADANGRFSVSGLHGGTYSVVTGDTAVAFRLWAPGTAPPAASTVAMAVVGNRVVRGQCRPCRPCRGYGSVGGLLRNPWVIATLVGAAVAIPIALADDDDDSAS